MTEHKARNLIKKIQENNNDNESMILLWNEYGNKLYSSFLKYFFSKKFNCPLEKEDFISTIFFSFKKAIINFDLNNNKYHFLQYAHVVTKSDAARYAKKFITKKQNILNNIVYDDKALIDNSFNNATQSLEKKYFNEIDKKLKLSLINHYLKLYSKNNLEENIEKIISLKLDGFKNKEISKLLSIDVNKINYQLNSFKKFIKNKYSKDMI